MKERLGVVFWVSAIAILLFVLWGATDPAGLAEQATKGLLFSTTNFGWFYLLSVMFFIVFCLYLAFSDYGKVRLGADRDRPEFSFFTWIGMLFSAGFGVGLVFWGVAEPMGHFISPPMGIESLSPEAARVSMRYSMFHWGIHQWSVFTVVGLVMAYFQFRKKSKGLISAAFEPLIGDRAFGPIGKSIDILAVIATVMGVATSLGLGILQMNGGLNYVIGLPVNPVSQLGLIGILLVLYLISATTGLKRGIKILSNLNLSLAFGLMLFVLMFGPTVFILNSFTLGLGEYIQRFVEMSFRLTPYTGGTWVRDWTIFYWAWAIAWAPFVGAFIARISKGRTIREFVFGVLIVPPFVAIVWMAVFGGSALHMSLFENLPIAQAVEQDVTSALFVTLEQFPFGFALALLAILLITTFLVTSADSATYVLGIMTTKGDLNPRNSVKIIWGVLQASIAGVLLLSSGLRGLQTASLIAALPITVIMILMCFSLLKSLKRDFDFDIDNDTDANKSP
jgi:glycine betaine transporter